jgi:hypothetical protein
MKVKAKTKALFGLPGTVAVLSLALVPNASAAPHDIVVKKRWTTTFLGLTFTNWSGTIRAPSGCAANRSLYLTGIRADGSGVPLGKTTSGPFGGWKISTSRSFANYGLAMPGTRKTPTRPACPVDSRFPLSVD